MNDKTICSSNEAIEPGKSLADLNDEIKSLRAENRRLKKRADADIRSLQAEIKIMRRSLSWRLTAPLRALARKFPRLGGRVVGTLKLLVNTSRALTIKNAEKEPPGRPFHGWAPREQLYDDVKKYARLTEGRKRKIVFYTAVFGDYENLLLPEVIDENIDYICFTDRPRNTYGVWQLRASPYYHSDPTRIARYVKTHPHQFFPQYDHAIWCDANIILRVKPQKYISKLQLDNKSLGFVPHPHRKCVYEEAEACKKRSKDEPAIIDQQVDHYQANGFDANLGMYETGFYVVDLADKNTRAMFNTWWGQIEKFSRRDQLSITWSLKSHAVKVTDLLPQGVSVREDPDFQYFSHADCKRLKIPYRLTALGKIEEPFGAVTFDKVKKDRRHRLQETSIDIVVCVYNALEDVRLCLEAAHKHLLKNHNLIIVNDRSDGQTTAFLREFSATHDRVTLLENEANIGYTQSANRGLAASTADLVIMLNSDTIVSPDWAIKLLDVAMSAPDIGIVGPLSNAAGIQSVPDIKRSRNNTPINTIPHAVSYHEIDQFLESTSLAETVPLVPLVHGFCFAIKRAVLDKIGLFDSENFKRYYGEEDDFCLRAAKAGFQLAIATNTFVYHSKSRSIEENERIIHMAEAGKKLRALYGREAILTACLQGEEHPLLRRMRAEVNEFYKSLNKTPKRSFGFYRR